MKFSKFRSPEDPFTASTFLTGVVTGLLTGLAVGVLFAPKSGKKTRKLINSALANQTKDIKNHLEKTKKQAKEKLDTLKDTIA